MAKKKKTVFKIIAVSVVYLSTAAIAIYLITNYINQPKFVRYPAFGIPIPVNYAIHGIDVSRHQAAIDWDDVSTMQDKNIKIGFTFIKATEGINNIDASYRRNWVKAREAKIPRGAYHFFISSKIIFFNILIFNLQSI